MQSTGPIVRREQVVCNCVCEYPESCMTSRERGAGWKMIWGGGGLAACSLQLFGVQAIGCDRLPHSVTKPLLLLPGMAGNLSRRSLFPKMPLLADGPRRRIRTWYLCGCIQPGTRVKSGSVMPCAYSDLVLARLYSARAPALRPVWFCLVRIRIERLCGAAYPD